MNFISDGITPKNCLFLYFYYLSQHSAQNHTRLFSALKKSVMSDEMVK